MKKTVPNLRGLEEKEAKKKLNEIGIKYEDEIEKTFSFLSKGKIVKTDPEKDSEIEENEKVTLYKSRGPLLIVLTLLILLVAGLSLSLSRGVFRSIIDQNIITGIKAPKVIIKDTGIKKDKIACAKDLVLQIENPNTKKKIVYYEYCINSQKGTKGCVWKSTTTNNIEVTENGHKYVSVRAIDEDGNRGQIAEVEVYIDNENPIITDLKLTKVTDREISVETKAKDDGCGINKYSYSLDGKTFKEGKEKYTFKDLESDKEYRIYVKVEDIIGNSIVVSINAKTLKEGTVEPTPTETPVVTPNPTNEPEPTDKPTPTVIPSATSTPIPTPTPTSSPEENFDIPQISLKDVPTKFVYKEKYELPSYVDFGNDTGTYECRVDGKVETTTENLKVGTHFIVCTAISSHNKQAMVEKEIEVKVTSGEDEVLDGWIRLNLYYPDGSINRQWRLLRDGEVRSEDDGWEDYTGPILIKVEDVENIYIRYDLDGETYIIPPSGRVLVDIEPEKWTLNDGETTKVKINFDKNATIKQYRINGGAWQDYTGEFEVDVKTLIDARVTKEEKVYNNLGEYVNTKKYSDTDTVYIGLKSEYGSSNPGNPGGGNNPGNPGGGYNPGNPGCPECPTYPEDLKLAGPVIKSNPNTGIVESTEITIVPQEEADVVYYQIGSGSWKQYTEPFDVTQNVWIKASYRRKSDGKQSQVSYYKVENIRVGQVPYVALTATPTNYLGVNVDKVTVSASASDYDDGTLEYSLDGKVYFEYTEPIEVTQSTRVYARARNSYGIGKDELLVTTTTAPKILENLSISINTSPSKEQVQGLVNKTKVSITYDSRATKKYYSLDGNNWLEYTGEFDLTQNTTIYAYATSENGKGEAELSVDFLTTGISRPIINANTRNKAYQVKVDIDFDKTATIKRYRIGNGLWTDYTGPFYVYENTTVYAYNKNELGYKSDSNKTINNIIPRPEIVTLDEGMYYLIRINYPEISNENSREYKWLSDGVWKKYDSKGILLIKQEYKDLVTQTASGIKVVDSKGKEVVVTDHYYFLTKPLYESMEDLYVRWDIEKPKAPTILFDTTDPAKEVEVAITYQKILMTKQYKVVYADGTDTGWLDYTEPFKINKNNAVVFAKGMNASEVETEISSKKVTNIDEVAPEINVVGDLTTPKKKVNLTVKATDNMGVDMVKYLQGKHSKEDFEDIDAIPNNSVVTITENDTYTFYVIDRAGFETIKEVEVSNIDLTAPNVVITVDGNSYLEASVSIDYGDAVTKQYKIGTNGTWKNYTDTFTIKASDVYSLANDDGTLTIYAKGTDSAGNESPEVAEVVYVLDLDMPKSPIINASAGYPILTEYGVKPNDVLTVSYDNRDDITNYICLKDCDNEDNWKVYTGYEHVNSGIVYAKSVKNISGLTILTSKSVVEIPNSTPLSTYDDDNNTGYVLTKFASGNKEVYMDVDSSMYNYDFEVDLSIPLYISFTAKFYDKDGNIINSKTYSNGYRQKAVFTVPESTTKIGLYATSGGNGGVTLYEIRPYDNPKATPIFVYPLLTEYGVRPGYNEINLVYFPTSVKKLYQIVGPNESLDENNWKNYNQMIKLKIGDTIYAKSMNRNNEYSEIYSYKSVLDSNALPESIYDGNEDTGYALTKYASGSKETFIQVDKSMYGLKCKLRMRIPLYISLTARYYNEFGEIISTQAYNNGYVQTQTLTIPDGTTKMGLYGTSGGNGGVTLYELITLNDPVINDIGSYPKLTDTGFEEINHKIRINYLSYLVDKEYSIDNGENWNKYTGEFAASVGTKVLARAKNQYGSYTPTATYTIADTTDSIGNEAIDNNHETIYTQPAKTSKSFLVDESLAGRKIKIYLNSTPATNSSINIYDFSGNLIGTNTITGLISVVELPANSFKVTITSGNSALQIKEIELRAETVLDGKNPLISVDNAEYTANKTVTITTKQNYVTQYSLDLGKTWVEYTNPVVIKNRDTIIIARWIDNNGKFIGASSMDITKIYDDIGIDESVDYDFTGDVQSFVAPATGIYKFEAWGAQGGSAIEVENDGHTENAIGGLGAYTSGKILLNKGEKIYVYVGGEGGNRTYMSTGSVLGGWNGGGQGAVARTSCYQQNGSGGGATDFRLVGRAWDNTLSLNSRIMVASGGGGIYENNCSASDRTASNGHNAIGLYSDLQDATQLRGGYGRTSYQSSYTSTTYAGAFGSGASGKNSYAGGGSGYYGGGSGDYAIGGGGSSYITGHKGCIAISSASSRTPRNDINGIACTESTTINDVKCSEHYSEKSFYNTKMIDGSGYEWTNTIGNQIGQIQPDGTISQSGHFGDGYARITFESDVIPEFTIAFDANGGNVNEQPKVVTLNDKIGALPTPTKEGMMSIFDGWYLDLDYKNKVTADSKVFDNMTLYAKWNVDADYFLEHPELIEDSTWTAAILSSSFAIDKLDQSNPFTSTDSSKVFASSSYSGHTVVHAFDDSDSSYWNPAAGASYKDQYVAYDFGTPVWLYKMVINVTDGKQNTDYVLEASNDKENYVILKDGLHQGGGKRTIIPDNYNQKYRYYRVRLLSTINQSGSGNTTISYLRFYAK